MCTCKMLSVIENLKVKIIWYGFCTQEAYTYNKMVMTSTDYILSVTVLGWWAKSFLGSAMNSCYLEWIGSTLSLPNICISFLSYSLKYCSQNFLCLLIALSSTSTTFTIPFGDQIIYGMAKKNQGHSTNIPNHFLELK